MIREIAQIDEARCIGCARCLPPCPFDAIVGARSFMHTVLNDLCTGCELCLPACPVDCIVMVPRERLANASPPPAARDNRERIRAHNSRIARRAEAQAALIASRKQAAWTS